MTQEGQERLRAQKIKEQLDKRYALNMKEYDALLKGSSAVKFGTRNVTLDTQFLPKARSAHGKAVLFLKAIKEYHREYEWIS